jgi:hypothetical protein
VTISGDGIWLSCDVAPDGDTSCDTRRRQPRRGSRDGSKMRLASIGPLNLAPRRVGAGSSRGRPYKRSP